MTRSIWTLRQPTRAQCAGLSEIVAASSSPAQSPQQRGSSAKPVSHSAAEPTRLALISPCSPKLVSPVPDRQPHDADPQQALFRCSGLWMLVAGQSGEAILKVLIIMQA